MEAPDLANSTLSMMTNPGPEKRRDLYRERGGGFRSTQSAGPHFSSKWLWLWMQVSGFLDTEVAGSSAPKSCTQAVSSALMTFASRLNLSTGPPDSDQDTLRDILPGLPGPQPGWGAGVGGGGGFGPSLHLEHPHLHLQSPERHQEAGGP